MGIRTDYILETVSIYARLRLWNNNIQSMKMIISGTVCDSRKGAVGDLGNANISLIALKA